MATLDDVQRQSREVNAWAAGHKSDVAPKIA